MHLRIVPVTKQPFIQQIQPRNDALHRCKGWNLLPMTWRRLQNDFWLNLNIPDMSRVKWNHDTAPCSDDNVSKSNTICIIKHAEWTDCCGGMSTRPVPPLTSTSTQAETSILVAKPQDNLHSGSVNLTTSIKCTFYTVGRYQVWNLQMIESVNNWMPLHRGASGTTWAAFIFGCYQVAVSRQAPAVKMQREITFLWLVFYHRWIWVINFFQRHIIQETSAHASSVCGGGQFIYTRRQHTHEERKREIGSPPWCPPIFSTWPVHNIFVAFCNFSEDFLTRRIFNRA